MGRAVHRHLALFHRLQQGGLGLGRGTVDLVRQDDLAHDRAGLEFHLARTHVHDRIAGHVGRRYIRRELDAAEAAGDGTRKRAGQRRLSDAGDVLQQDMALADQRDEHQLDGLVLPDDDLADVLLQTESERTRAFRIKKHCHMRDYSNLFSAPGVGVSQYAQVPSSFSA